MYSSEPGKTDPTAPVAYTTAPMVPVAPVAVPQQVIPMAIYNGTESSRIDRLEKDQRLARYYEIKRDEVRKTKQYNCCALFWLCFFFGEFGAHRWFVIEADGWVLPLVQLLTLGGCGIWYIVDCFWICCCHFTNGANLRWIEKQIIAINKEEATMLQAGADVASLSVGV